MVFAPELNDEKQNLLAFLLGAALRACDRPGGYKELQQMGFGRKHIIEMLQTLGHDTDRLAMEYKFKTQVAESFDMCLCGHFANMHTNRNGECIDCMACPMFRSIKLWKQ